MKLCALIPSYNHHTKLGTITERLFALHLPVILVDDASGPEASAAMRALAQDSRITLVRHEHNQGKGGAVMSGMQEAIRQGYTHALQVDADGQHDLAS
ncbi:glycosyltransferase, partial [Bowmanella dokdonensis]